MVSREKIELLPIKLNTFFKILKYFIFIVVLGFILSRFDIHQVSGFSMYPCFNDGDIILTSKRKSNASYGSIIVFKKANSDELYLKRIIGVPSDTIVIQDDGIYIFSGNTDIVDFFQYDNCSFFNENNSSCCLKIPTIDSLNAFPSAFKKIIVKPNTFFVVGDNMNNSYDSRHFGLINSNQVIDIFLKNLF